MRAAILAFLQADGVLMGILTGGLHDEPIDQEVTEAAFDANGELLPCGYVGVSSDTPTGPVTEMRAGLMIVQVFLYQHIGHDKIDAAAARIRLLLHKRMVMPASGGAWPLLWANDIPDREAPELDARMTVTRYSAYYTSPAPV